MGLCDPYVTTDGYGEELILACDIHNTAESIMVDGKQTEEVTLTLMIKIVAAHRRDH